MKSEIRIPTIHKSHIEQIDNAIADVSHPGQILLQDIEQRMVIVAGIDDNGILQGITMTCPVDELTVQAFAKALNPTKVPAVFLKFQSPSAGEST